MPLISSPYILDQAAGRAWHIRYITLCTGVGLPGSREERVGPDPRRQGVGAVHPTSWPAVSSAHPRPSPPGLSPTPERSWFNLKTVAGNVADHLADPDIRPRCLLTKNFKSKCTGTVSKMVKYFYCQKMKSIHLFVLRHLSPGSTYTLQGEAFSYGHNHVFLRRKPQPLQTLFVLKMT